MAVLYKVNGEKVDVRPKNGKDFKLEELRELLHCDWVEVAHMPRDGHFFLVDEEGKLTGKPLNVRATKIYSYYYNDYIVGDALLCSPTEFK